MKYLVRWEIDSDAATPLEAAREARAAQLQPDTSATVFDVYEPDAPFTDEDNRFRRGLHGPKPTRIDMMIQGAQPTTEMQTAQAFQPASTLGGRVIFKGERLLDKVTCKYYVPQQWLVERVNEKLEQAAQIAEDSGHVMTPIHIRALKETL